MLNESPVQVLCMIQDARGWCTGMTQRDGMGREVGGGFRMGNTCTPVADSCWCMAKPVQYCKVKKKKKVFIPRPPTLKGVFPPFSILHSFLRITKISPIFVPLNRQCFFFEYFLRFSLSLVFKNWVVMWLFVVFFMFILLVSEASWICEL